MRWNKVKLGGLGFLVLLALANCATPSPNSGQNYQNGPVCRYESVSFSGEFDGGRLSACRQEGASRFVLYFQPEDTPINPSAWYAFAIDTSSKTNLDLTFNYVHGSHRYAPKISVDSGKSWALLDIAQPPTGKRVRFVVPAAAGQTLVAAQPLFNLDRYHTWMSILDRLPGVDRKKIGESEAGRDIEAVSFGQAGAPVLVLLGRQHPPEIPGAIAMQAFVGRLLEDDPLAVQFRQSFRVEMIPVLNPDGVALGHWRHNTRGVDLNRDWGPFTQSETRAARDWMANLGDLAVAIDFHAMKTDTLFTQPDGAAGARTGFARGLSEFLTHRFGEKAPVRNAGHNPGLPTSKTWIHVAYQIPAMTFETGDATPIADVNEIARVAAEASMQLLLDETK